MNISLDELLRLSRFRKIIRLMPTSNKIKISVDQELHDISRIIDKNDVLIIEVEDL